MTAKEEAENILKLTDHNMFKALDILDKQLSTLHTRAQVLMSLAGVTVTVTGFSGRLIAGTSPLAQLMVIAGLSTVLVSAVWVYLRVMGIKWMTSMVEGEKIESLELAIKRRNKKTVAYATGGKILFLGLAFYSIAFALLLLNP